MSAGARKTGLDIVRCVALLFIIGVHFFYHNGFYWQKQTGMTMFIADVVRWLTFTCVSIFVMLTGYLKAEKKLDRNHYKGIVAVLVTWLVTSIICIIFKEVYLHKGQGFSKNLLDFIQYKGADYAWYIELYIGLFMLIPFLNQGFGWERDRKYHNALIATMSFTTFVPSCINYVAGEIFPNYLVSLWPLAYYYIGCYIRKYQPQINKFVCLGIITLFSVIRAARTFLSAKGQDFYKGIGGGYSDLYVAIITVFVFLMFYDVEVKNKKISGMFAHVSKLSLHVYLLSSIADALFNQLIKAYNAPAHYWWVFPVRCLWVFVVSLAMSELVYPISSRIGGTIIDVFFTKKDSESEDLLK